MLIVDTLLIAGRSCWDDGCHFPLRRTIRMDRVEGVDDTRSDSRPRRLCTWSFTEWMVVSFSDPNATYSGRITVQGRNDCWFFGSVMHCLAHQE